MSILIEQQPRTGLQKFLAAARNCVGTAFVRETEDDIAHYARSTSSRSVRSLAIVQPADTAEVQALVQLTRRHQVALYPISRGCNWGLGDACPTTPNQVILDLRRMNRITTADAELGAFTVEPGVTQQQMFEYLRDNQLPFWYDASGAGPDASLIGNLMERGYGHTPLGERFQNTCNYQVVLPSGELMHTGFGDSDNCAVKDLFKPGVGPSLDGLFTQSNLGIVTRATFWMMPIPQHFEAYAIQLRSDECLGRCIEALRPLRASGAIASAIHFGNDFRVFSARQRYPYDQLDGTSAFPEILRRQLREDMGVAAWNGLGAFYGSRVAARAFRSELRTALRGIARPIFLSERFLNTASWFGSRLSWVPAIAKLSSKLASAKPVIALLKGEPVPDHLSGAAWRTRTAPADATLNPIDRGDGILWFTPLLPNKSQDVLRVNSIMEHVFAKHGFEPLLTFVMISSRTLVCPTTICYDQKCSIQTACARECYRELASLCAEAGYLPYRSSSFSTSHAASLSKFLKQQIDPESSLAPGRYGL